jgi:hypothetical protein
MERAVTWGPGDHIVIRSAGDFVRAARPTTVIEDDGEGIVAYLSPGTQWFGPLIENRATVVRDAANGTLQRGLMTWTTHHTLLIVRPGDEYSPYGMWNGSGELVCWYINLQEPMRRSPIGYDTRDQLLDIVFAPDLQSWTWKDENELEEAIGYGFFTQERAAQVRRSGEAVIELVERGDAWWTHWGDWAPDPSWPIPVLPESWDVL